MTGALGIGKKSLSLSCRPHSDAYDSTTPAPLSLFQLFAFFLSAPVLVGWGGGGGGGGGGG